MFWDKSCVLGFILRHFLKPKTLFPLNKSYSNIVFNNMEIKVEHGNLKIVLELIYNELYGIV